jgi:hypothetical protein
MVDYQSFGILACLLCGSHRLVGGEVKQEECPATETSWGGWLSTPYGVYVHVECLVCAHEGFVALEQQDEEIVMGHYPSKCPPGCPDEATHQAM